MSKMTRELIDIVLGVPTIPADEWHHGMPHVTHRPDLLEIEKQVDQWFKSNSLPTVREGEYDASSG